MGKNKKNGKRKLNLKDLKSNKQKFFVFTYHKRLNNIINKYNCKANMHNLILKNKEIRNVNFRGAIITNCNFQGTKLDGVDFIGTNLKGTNFSGANLRNVIFCGTKLTNCNFNNCTFFNVTFVNVNLKQTLNFKKSNPQIQILSSYPKLNLKQNTIYSLKLLSEEDEIYKYHTLHIKKSKYNMLSIYLLLQKFSEQDIARGLKKLAHRINKRRFYTVYSIEKFLESYYHI